MNRWKRGKSSCLLVPVAAAASGTEDTTGEKCFSSSLLIQKWGKALLELWGFMVSENLLQFFFLASLGDLKSSLLCFSVAVIVVVNCPNKEIAIRSYQAITFLFCQPQLCIQAGSKQGCKEHNGV